jgi:hypothetical protein
VTDEAGLEQQAMSPPKGNGAFLNFSTPIIAKIYADAEIPTSLYHYTSSQGLLGILGEHKLWFSDAGYMNDGSETTYGVAIAKLVIDEFTETMSDHQKQAGEELKAHIDEAARYFQAVIFCMSARDNLLNQWRDYGKDIVPYSIEFVTTELELWRTRSFPIFLSKVIYDQKFQKTLMHELLAAIYAATISLLGGRSEFEENEAKQHLISAATEIINLITRFKNPAFEAEEEWRAIAYRPDVEKRVKRKYRSSSLGVVPYYEWSAVEEPVLLPVRGVTVGPSPYAQVSDLALKQYLIDCGYGEIRTSFSIIPIRR